MLAMADLGVTAEDCVYPVEISRQQAPMQQGPCPASSDDPNLLRGTSQSSDTRVWIDSLLLTDTRIQNRPLDLRFRK